MNIKHTLLAVLATLIFVGCSAQAAKPADIAPSGVAAVAAPVLTNRAASSTNTTGQPSSNKAEKLAEFSTSFKDAVKSRAHNIAKASSAIDETVVGPGETFSFNETVGPTSKAKGFMLARIFVRGRDSKGYGGGVCQVSSTLFNAVDKAGLQVTERHEHSKEVGYVEKGRDATTSYGAADFKFVNDKPYPIRINSYVNNEKGKESVTVELFAI